MQTVQTEYFFSDTWLAFFSCTVTKFDKAKVATLSYLNSLHKAQTVQNHYALFCLVYWAWPWVTLGKKCSHEIFSQDFLMRHAQTQLPYKARYINHHINSSQHLCSSENFKCSLVFCDLSIHSGFLAWSQSQSNTRLELHFAHQELKMHMLRMTLTSEVYFYIFK